MEGCPADEQLQRMLDAQIGEPERRAFDAHLASCSSCAAVIAHLGAQLPVASTLGEEVPPGSVGPRFEPGDRIGRYVIERRVGSGGMGDVYAAHDPQLDRHVALKLLRRRGAELDEGLLREARTMARVDHPNVVPIFDVGEHEGRSYVAMAFVRGTTLRAWLRTPRSWQAILDMFGAAGEGLAAAHAAGVIHRDFKPDNVLIDEQGRPRVADFGAAAVGTPAYMPPEQIEGAALDPRADSFSFCVALWEALYGAAPFSGDTLRERLAAIRAAQIVEPRTAKVPRWLRAAVRSGLHAEPAHRPASMRVLLDALDRRRARRRVIAIATASVLAAAAMIIVLARRSHTPVWHPDIRDMLPKYEENSGLLAISPDGTQIAFPSDRDQPDEGGRIYVGSVHGGASHPVSPRGSIHLLPKWARDGQSIYYIDTPTWVAYRVELATGTVTTIASGVHDAVECGAGGLLLNYMSAPDCPTCQRFVLRDRRGNERELTRGRPGDWLIDPDCDARGTQLAYGWASGTKTNLRPQSDIWTIPLTGGEPRRLTNEPSALNREPAWTPDATIVYSAIHDDRADLWEIAARGGTPRRLTTTGAAQGADVSPDGSLVVFNEDVTSTPIIAVDATGTRNRITHTQDEYADPQATPDGKEVIAVVHRGNRTLLVAISIATSDERELAEGVLSAVTPDGARVAYIPAADRSQLRVVPRAGGASQRVADLPGVIDGIEIAADGVAHLRVRGDSGYEAFSVALTGDPAPKRELPAPWCQLLPAPRGGWTAVATCKGIDLDVHLIAPGGSLDDPHAPILPVRSFAWDPDGQSFVYTRERHVYRQTLGTFTDTPVVTAGVAEQGVAAGPDHMTFATELVGHVHRKMLVNFAERSRL